MNVLHINTNDLRGGAAKVMDRLIVAQNDKGHDARAIVKYKELNVSYTFPFDIEPNNVDELFVKANGMIDYEYRGGFNLIRNPLFQKADVFHIHNAHGYYLNPYVLSVLSHFKPIIWTLHDMQSITGHCSYAFDCEKWKTGCGNCPNLNEYPAVSVDRTNANWLEKRDIYNHSKLFIVPVAKWIENIAKQGILKDQAMQTVLNGVDINIYRPLNKKELREKYGIPMHKIIIGAVANGGTFGQERKGGKYVQFVLDKLISEGYEVLLLNVGGTERGYITESLYDVGYISNEHEMAEVYNLFDIYLFPSLADTGPLVVTEAMACGIPIVTFATGGIPEVVSNNETGFVTPRGDKEKLYECVLKLVKNSDLRDEMSIKSRENCIKNFDHNDVVEKYTNIYQNAIENFSFRKDKILHFDQISVPSVVANSREFQQAEALKGKGLPMVSEIEQNLHIISSDNRKIPGKMTPEESSIWEFNETDIVYVERPNFHLDKVFFEVMLYKGMQTDVLSSSVRFKKNGGEDFFSLASGIQYTERIIVNTSYGGILYKGDFFNDNKQAILNGKMVEATSKEEFYTEMVTIKIDDFVNQHFRKEMYIYGAGTHTVELLRENKLIQPFVKGIIDKNTSLHGKKLLNQYEIHPIDKIDNASPILISSATFEREIYKTLSHEINNPLLTLYNN